MQVLRGQGYEVRGIDLAPPIDADEDTIRLDLRDAASLNDVLAGCDALIHFGSPPEDNGRSTSEAFHMLAVAGFNVFQAAKNVGIRRIAWASSIEVYGDLRTHPGLPVTEESPVAPPGIYGCSKLLLERLAEDYCRWHGMAIAGLRLGRIIYDNEAGRAKLKRFVDDEALGHDCLWSYVDARDVATACVAWLESDHPGAEIFNLAAANVHQDVSMTELLGRHGYAGMPVGSTEGEDRTLFSTRKIRDRLGWAERYDWHDILDGTPGDA